jgi:carboxylesterase
VLVDAPGSKRALVLHGFGDTPQSVQALTNALVSAGYAVSVPLLPGHGRTLRALDESSEDAWCAAASAAWADCCATGSYHVLAGQSMGGALAVVLASARAPSALVLVAPFLTVTPFLRRAATLSPLWGLVLPYRSTADAASLQDADARRASRAYGATTARAARALVRLADTARVALPQVSAPTLFLQSREDNRITPADAESSFAALGAPDKTLRWRTGAGHVLLADRGREEVAMLVLDWLAAQQGTTPAQASSLLS